MGNAPVSSDGVVLLEDVSNLLANTMFEKGGSSDSVFRDICALADRCRIFLIVTIAGLKDDGYDEETAAYINGLNDINRKLFEKASIAISMQDGTPVYQKVMPMFLFESLLVALSTYSVVPVPQFEWNDRNMKYAICFFPAVGIFCGAILWGWFALAELLEIGSFSLL